MPSKTGYGKVMIPCTTLVTQWEKTQKVKPGVLVKDVLAVAKRENGAHPWTIKSIATLLEGRCMIGTVTGTCTNSYCRHDHTLVTPSDMAKRVKVIVEAGTLALGK